MSSMSGGMDGWMCMGDTDRCYCHCHHFSLSVTITDCRAINFDTNPKYESKSI